MTLGLARFPASNPPIAAHGLTHLVITIVGHCTPSISHCTIVPQLLGIHTVLPFCTPSNAVSR
ncbi:MAG: hypothetical protein ACTSUH_10310, partial [Candidatus Thorarchaeota archaeon]